jgi:hypothetical protein
MTSAFGLHGENLFIIRIQDGRAVLRQDGNQFALLGRDRFLRMKKADVIASDVGHDANLWLKQPESVSEREGLVS